MGVGAGACAGGPGRSSAFCVAETYELLARSLAAMGYSFAVPAHKLLHEARRGGIRMTHGFLWHIGQALRTPQEVRDLFPELQLLRPDAPGDTPNHMLLLKALVGAGHVCDLSLSLSVSVCQVLHQGVYLRAH